MKYKPLSGFFFPISYSFSKSYRFSEIKKWIEIFSAIPRYFCLGDYSELIETMRMTPPSKVHFSRGKILKLILHSLTLRWISVQNINSFEIKGEFVYIYAKLYTILPTSLVSDVCLSVIFTFEAEKYKTKTKTKQEAYLNSTCQWSRKAR